MFTDLMFSHSLGMMLCFDMVSELMLLFIPLICVSVLCGQKMGVGGMPSGLDFTIRRNS